jgi:hypothetical protein
MVPAEKASAGNRKQINKKGISVTHLWMVDLLEVGR